MTTTAETRLDEFIAAFAPAMQRTIRACRHALQRRYPDAVQLVWDNYNFLVIGFSGTRRPSDSVFSLAAQARGINLCFLQHGADLADPTSILRGSGKVVRNVRLDSAADLERADVVALMDAADALVGAPVSTNDAGLVLIQSVSAKQRPRR